MVQIQIVDKITPEIEAFQKKEWANADEKYFGKMLMEKAEAFATKEKLHKIYLETGATWGVVDFYKKLGYRETATLPDHYLKQDYIILSKLL